MYGGNLSSALRLAAARNSSHGQNTGKRNLPVKAERHMHPLDLKAADKPEIGISKLINPAILKQTFTVK